MIIHQLWKILHILSRLSLHMWDYDTQINTGFLLINQKRAAVDYFPEWNQKPPNIFQSEADRERALLSDG